MSEEKKNEVLEQGELNESKLDEVVGGMSTTNSTVGATNLVNNFKNENGRPNGVNEKNTFTFL